MPTLTWLDSFQHQVPNATSYGTNAGVYDSMSNPGGVTYVTGRRAGSTAIQIAEDGATSTRVGKNWAAGVRTIVESFYFKVSSIPSVDSTLWHAVDASGNFQINVLASSGFLKWVAVGGAANAKTMSVNVADGLWHRIDLYCKSTANPGTMDLSFDGVAQAQATGAFAAADITTSRLGSTTAAHTLTVQIADWVCSQTSGDHPIGPHAVNALIPNADGTHNWASTNMGNGDGGLASSTNVLWQSVDDFPLLVGNYIEYRNTSATSTEYAEVLMPDADALWTVWGARAVAAINSQSTASNAATTRIVDGAGSTVLDLYVGDQSDSAARHQASMLSGINTPTLLNALKFRVGFPTDSNPNPRWQALMIDYAVLQVDGTASPSAVAGVGAVPAPTASGNGVASPAAVAGIGAVPAPTASGGGGVDGTAAPDTVAGVGAVPAATARGTATASPSATAGIGAVPDPTASGTANTSPATVAGIGSVPSPSVTGTAVAAPSTTVGIGTVPAPTASGDALATAATVAGVGSVPAPAATGDGVALPAEVAGIGDVPAPTASGASAATATPEAVAGLGSVPAPAATGEAAAAPNATAGTGSIPAPTGRGDANVNPGTTAGTGTVLGPTAYAAGASAPAAVGGVGSVPAPVTTGTATALPPVVAGLSTIPAAIARGAANASPPTVVGAGDVPAPTMVSVFVVHPDTVAGIGAVPAPRILGGTRVGPAVRGSISGHDPTGTMDNGHMKGTIAERALIGAVS